MDKDLTLPDFLIAGSMKSGTTTLVDLLNRHPEISLPQRELYFFSFRTNFGKGLRWYAGQIAKHTERRRILGEKCVSYGYVADAAPRIKQFLPGAKMVWILRNPVLRTYSNYAHNFRNGLETLSFGEALKREATGSADNVYLRYLQRSCYALEIERFLGLFPRDQIHVLLLEELVSAPLEALRGLFKFLGLNDSPYEYAHTHSNPGGSTRLPSLVRMASEYCGYGSAIHLAARRLCTTGRPYPPMTADARSYLIEFFAGRNAELASLLGRDLSPWRME